MTTTQGNTRVPLTLSKCLAAALLSALTGSTLAHAATRVWNAGAGDWFDGTKWTGGVPGPADDAVITNAGASVQLTNSTAIGALTLSRTLTFVNWGTTLTVTNATVQSGGTITLPAAFATGAMSNRVVIVSSNDVVVAAGAMIDANSRGFAAGAINASGHGPGAGAAYNGAGHGGAGGSYNGGPGGTYGSTNAPLDPGSGGGGGNAGAGSGNGGGAIRIAAGGRATVHGIIRANGGSGGVQFAGGGSGGSIFITCHTFGGTGGVLQANGGIAENFSGFAGGTGSGGRIAIVYDTAAQSAEPLPTVALASSFGVSPVAASKNGEIGTIWTSDSRVLPRVFDTGGAQLLGFTSWSVDSLTLSNSWLKLPPGAGQTMVTNALRIVDVFGRLDVSASSSLNVGGDLSVTNGRLVLATNCALNVGGNLSLAAARLDALTNGTLNVGGNLLMTNGASLYVHSGPTNAGAPVSGAIVGITGDVQIANACWIYPASDPINGGSPLFRMRNLTITTTNAGFNADARGFAGGSGLVAGYGYGKGSAAYAGAGYGGAGGNYGGNPGGGTYGSSNAPVDAGSGGGGGDVGLSTVANGGGLVRIEASGTIAMNGTITAQGGSGSGGANQRGGGGSGGGIYLTCKTFAGTNGVLTAGGGNAASTFGGGGGGGRIAVSRTFDISTPGGMSTGVQGGAQGASAGSPGNPGSVVWIAVPPPGTTIVIR